MLGFCYVLQCLSLFLFLMACMSLGSVQVLRQRLRCWRRGVWGVQNQRKHADVILEQPLIEKP